ncbi:MAG: hypothetical protein QXZ11_00335 [Thermoproteota archaeon]
MGQINGIVFRSGAELYDWYTSNKINFGVVVDEFFFGDGAIFHASFADKTITDQPYTREEFDSKVDAMMLQAFGLMASMYLIGYAQAITALLQAEAEKAHEPLILVPQNGKFIN